MNVPRAGISRDSVERLIHTICVRDPKAGLREEDLQKVSELCGLLPELDRVLPKRGGVLVDAACGRAYVGIAAAVLLRPGLRVIGIEAEPRRAELARVAAAALGVDAEIRCVRLDEATIEPVSNAGPSNTGPTNAAPTVLVALHACGPALDAALTLGIRIRARHILAVPCCHQKDPGLDPLFLHRGALRMRVDRDLQDYRRQLRLEAEGWVTETVEVFPARVSPQNLLLRARLDPSEGRQEKARGLLARVAAVGG